MREHLSGVSRELANDERANQDACIDEVRACLVGQCTRFPSGDHERVVEIARYGRIVFVHHDGKVVAIRTVAYLPRARRNRCLFQRIGMRRCDSETIVGVRHRVGASTGAN